MATKLITIVGITGTQGASVADAYINEPGWKIRGISRDPSKASSKAWTDQGVDMVFADLDDIGSLKTAFSGSNVICGVTDFWQQMQDKGNQERAKRTGKTINVISFEAEIQQGRNIVDAAQSTIVTLDMLVLSVLTDSRKWSGGKITWNYHFESKWRIVEYLQENYPGLHGKSSFFQAACYLSNLDTTLAPRMNLGVEVKYQRGTVDAMDKLMPGGMGMEFGEALEYLNSPGYYGGEAAIRELNLITPDDLTEVREFLKERTLL
ncbi:uncharacterized protein MYCGRDRAFT_91165 [Zymoseptoria tritici IPO323]|uniref:NmrA-like domain-containing protein n=1 Tax=Zymoseptoria tritici (strain CBS 115943 / IPO323) TaxID=336722 RepID=F9X404_ZYMTI|nr:uncharacterized protein MYCGRDRAFT_91165 [Zymoseptoria tritici IPO323]EGP90279.1 hypothetical protein MYCGRDRAFT_91165 [Zymoseptoria tritici IPO323]